MKQCLLNFVVNFTLNSNCYLVTVLMVVSMWRFYFIYLWEKPGDRTSTASSMRKSHIKHCALSTDDRFDEMLWRQVFGQCAILCLTTAPLVYVVTDYVAPSAARRRLEIKLHSWQEPAFTFVAYFTKKVNTIMGLSTHPGTGVDGTSGRRWKLADFRPKHVSFSLL